MLEWFPAVFGAGWASGVNAYLTALIIALGERFWDLDGVPDTLARTDVTLVLALLAVLELVADKLAFLDSFWDVLQTPLRPAVGAALGALLAGSATDLSSAATVGAAAVGGTTALVSHVAKASLRLGVNSSPEPASNVVLSSVEDVLVSLVAVLVLLAPWVAFGLSVLLLTVFGAAAFFLVSRIRRGYRRLRARLRPA